MRDGNSGRNPASYRFDAPASSCRRRHRPARLQGRSQRTGFRRGAGRPRRL